MKFVVEHPKYAERELEQTLPGLAAEAVLDPGTTWSGRVVRPDGSVLEHCEIGLTMEHPPVSRSASCSAAGFVLDHLPLGHADLRISTRAKGDSQLGERVLLEEVRIQRSPRRDEDVQWPSGEAISGSVVNQGGTPLAGVGVVAMPLSTPPTRDGSSYGVATLSDAQGRFALRHLTFSGPWLVKLNADNYRGSPVKAKGGAKDVVLTVSEKGRTQ